MTYINGSRVPFLRIAGVNFHLRKTRNFFFMKVKKMRFERKRQTTALRIQSHVLSIMRTAKKKINIEAEDIWRNISKRPGHIFEIPPNESTRTTRHYINTPFSKRIIQLSRKHSRRIRQFYFHIIKTSTRAYIRWIYQPYYRGIYIYTYMWSGCKAVVRPRSLSFAQFSTTQLIPSTHSQLSANKRDIVCK